MRSAVSGGGLGAIGVLAGMTASGPQCVRNRCYDLATGLSTQPDPIGLAGGLNLYRYAGGDPVNHWDPFGLRVDDSGLSQFHRQLIWKLRRRSKTFGAWYRLIDNNPNKLLVLRNPVNDSEAEFVAHQGGGYYFGNGGGSGTIVLQHQGASRRGQMEWESIVAHEFAHAVAGLEQQGGTSMACIDVASKEACATEEANRVHAEIGWRGRRDYDDLGPFKPTTTENPHGEGKKP